MKAHKKRVHVRKRLLQINLKELYQFLTENFPEVKSSFFKFASLQPKHFVLAGASGIDSVSTRYYRHNNGKTRMKSFVITSECLHYNIIAIHVLLKHVKNIQAISLLLFFID